MTADEISRLPTPETDAAAIVDSHQKVFVPVDVAMLLERQRDAAIAALIDLEYQTARINRYRDQGRHPDACIALVNARTTLAAIREGEMSDTRDDRKGV